MICTRCNAQMVVGYAIDPLDGNLDRLHSKCVNFNPTIIDHENLQLIYCWKCPGCGHSEIDAHDPESAKRIKMKELENVKHVVRGREQLKGLIERGEDFKVYSREELVILASLALESLKRIQEIFDEVIKKLEENS